MNPDEVADKINIRTWYRWQIWTKAKASREIWQAWRTPNSDKNFDAAQQRLFNWPVGEEY